MASVTVALPRILCVDDEPNVLAGLRQLLRRQYDVTIASSGPVAIETVKAQGPFVVVVSDLQMPAMDGIEFLRWVSQYAPDTARILLTGNANLSSAIAAVNAGSIFRFLTKPCPLPILQEAITAGHNWHMAKCSERVLLGQAVDQDAVTGLPDRRRFARDFVELQRREPGIPIALVVIAINELELIKRTLGHGAADVAIVAAARRLQAALRGPHYQLRDPVLYRIDDQLAILWCEHVASPADRVAAHLLRGMETDICLGDQNVRLGGHAGIAVLGPGLERGSTADPFVVLRNAEAACVEAGSGRGSRIAHFSTSMHAREQRRLRLLQGLRDPQFLANLSCVFQPQWELKGNRLIGLEALARWQDPELGSISPSEFIPLIEQDPDLANQLADWMVIAACRQRREWRTLIPDDVRVAVNFSAVQLQSGELNERIRSALDSADLPPALFEAEITESAAIADFAHSTAVMNELRHQGIGVSIDDFGVGYSSLSYLADLPATCLKIDRAFVQGIDGNRRRIELLSGICSLGHAMHMYVIVEGVESLATAKWLSTVGCDAVQGYAIARPLAAAAFADWYEHASLSVAAALLDEESRLSVFCVSR